MTLANVSAQIDQKSKGEIDAQVMGAMKTTTDVHVCVTHSRPLVYPDGGERYDARQAVALVEMPSEQPAPSTPRLSAHTAGRARQASIEGTSGTVVPSCITHDPWYGAHIPAPTSTTYVAVMMRKPRLIARTSPTALTNGGGIATMLAPKMMMVADDPSAPHPIAASQKFTQVAERK